MATQLEVTRTGIAPWPFIITIIALVVGSFKIRSYEFYILLRLLVCGVAVYGAIQAHSQERTGWACLLGGVAVLFNPLIPIHLTKSVWVVLDLATAGLLGVVAFILRQRSNP